jgi:(+)-pinoresinol hydroxylase
MTVRKIATAAAAATALAIAASAPAQQQDAHQVGRQVFDAWCAPCHGDGPGNPGTAALEALYRGQKPALLEQRTDLVPELTRTFVRNGVSIMPFFRKTEISDEELQALAAYLAP